MDFIFFFNSALLGVGLAMDAFSVSIANGMHDTLMKRSKTILIPSVFAFFQWLMPMLGWVFVTLLAKAFAVFEMFIPFIALGLLLFIGIKMIVGSLKCDCEVDKPCKTGFWALIVQGIATSIDALSVGFTIASYSLFEAFIASLVIAVVTFGICFAGVFIGKKAGRLLGSKAEIIGGVILILIGIEIFLTGIL